MNSLIGKIYLSQFQFYDKQKGLLSFKGRPILIIGEADANDYSNNWCYLSFFDVII